MTGVVALGSKGFIPGFEKLSHSRTRIQEHRKGDPGGLVTRASWNVCKYEACQDPMFFYDEIFAVEPLSGRIWAKSKVAITFTFTPKAWAPFDR